MLNLLITNINPSQAAQDLDDRRVAKGVLDTTQILCTAASLKGCWNRAMYRPRGENDPTVVWTCYSKNNLIWTYKYAMALAAEWKIRMGKTGPHGSELVSDIVWETFKQHPECMPNRVGLTPFVNYTRWSGIEATVAFQKLLCEHKFDATSRWTGRSKPGWFYIPTI